MKVCALEMTEPNDNNDERPLSLLSSQEGSNYEFNAHSKGNTHKDYAWLAVFCATGVGLGMSFEYLALQSANGHSPAAADTFFLCFIGYWAQTIVGGGYVFCLWFDHRKRQHHQQYSIPQEQSTITDNNNGCDDSDPFRGRWTLPVLRALFLSALFDGAAQALDYVGQVNGGYVLFTIFHSSVTIFSCAIAVVMLGTRVSPGQWTGIVFIVAGILVTALPQPVVVTGNFFVGLVCSCVGSLCLAAAYPWSELVFKLGEQHQQEEQEQEQVTVSQEDHDERETNDTDTDSNVRLTNSTVSSSNCLVVGEEMACFVGSLLNTALFTVWTLVYTVPRWGTSIVDYIQPGHQGPMVFGFILYGAMVGLHSLSFWMSVHRMGTVPCAVAKGAQQAGIFVFSHLIYCRVDASECIDSGDTPWARMQKSVAFVCCCAGVAIYALNRRTEESDARDDLDEPEGEAAGLIR